MSLYKGTTPVAGLAKNTVVNGFHIFDFKWSDKIINDISWLRSSTFSWQNGTTYSTAYNHLVTDISGITAETETIGSYTVTFYRATDGHKICLADQESTVANIFSSTGIAWYYILDTTNTQFKLPRTKWGFEGLRDTVGNKIEESLPNITGTVGDLLSAPSSYSGAFTKTSNGYKVDAGTALSSNATFGGLTFNASGSSSTYQDGAPVQERATQMYLYFYVGEFTQTAIEQTAGLNSEQLNNKVDKTGDTMTGTLNVATQNDSRGLNVNCTTYNQTSLPASGSVNSNYIDFTDNQGRVLTRFYHWTDQYGSSAFNIQYFYNNSYVTDFGIGRVGGKQWFSKPQIIATYVSGTSGYRIWSDGYCEQWGQLASSGTYDTVQWVSFLKTFNTEEYNLYLTDKNLTTGSYTYGGSYVNTLNTTGFHWCHYSQNNNYGNNLTLYWKACGYLASDQY